MTLDIAKLKAAAEKATPGPWRLTVTRFNGITRGPFSLTKEDALANAAEKVDAEFIAAANPAAVLELIAALEAKDAQIAELLEKQRLIDICQGQGLEHRIAAEKRAEAAEKRIAELEAQTVMVELPRGYVGPYGSLVYDADAVEAALELAGINLEKGGE